MKMVYENNNNNKLDNRKVNISPPNVHDRAIDRSESIRRAEEMLSQFIKEEKSSKRPEFLKNRKS